jgi:hypothetical protein
VRGAFGYPADLDGDGCDTAPRCCKAESITPAQVDPVGCTVVAGDWLSLYDGVTVTSPGELEIDHVVALKERGTPGVAVECRCARDLRQRSQRQSGASCRHRGDQPGRGDKDPSNWLPRTLPVCPFIGDWVAIKAR